MVHFALLMYLHRKMVTVFRVIFLVPLSTLNQNKAPLHKTAALPYVSIQEQYP